MKDIDNDAEAVSRLHTLCSLLMHSVNAIKGILIEQGLTSVADLERREKTELLKYLKLRGQLCNCEELDVDPAKSVAVKRIPIVEIFIAPRAINGLRKEEGNEHNATTG